MQALKKKVKRPKKYLGACIREKEILQMCIRDTHQKIKRDRYVYKLTAMLRSFLCNTCSDCVGLGGKVLSGDLVSPRWIQ